MILLLLIDGVVIRDPALIYNLDPESVEKIDAIKSRLRSWVITCSPGLVNVITTKGILENIKSSCRSCQAASTGIMSRKTRLNLSGLFSKGVFDRAIYLTSGMRFTGMLCLYLLRGKRPGLEFFGSDFISDYEISVRGVTNKRKFCYSKKIHKNSEVI